MKKSMLMVAALAVGSPAAFGQVAASAAPDRFAAADDNKDGYVDRDEYGSFVIEQVLVQDTNDDGRISPAETHDPQATAQFDKVDANDDGVCSLEEVEAWSAGDFNFQDTDHDGRISRTEATAAGSSR